MIEKALKLSRVPASHHSGFAVGRPVLSRGEWQALSKPNEKPQTMRTNFEPLSLALSKSRRNNTEIGSGCMLWQDHGKRCSVWPACARPNRDGASVLFDYLLADPEAKAVSCRTFGREKRLKYPR